MPEDGEHIVALSANGGSVRNANMGILWFVSWRPVLLVPFYVGTTPTAVC